MNLIEIENRSEKIPFSGCWIWMKGLNDGYGWYKRKRAHILSYEIVHGEVPSGLYVCHKCDVAACVNPGHLFLGTAKQNSEDAVAKGRRPKGESHGRALLSNEQVREIRSRYPQESQASLGRVFGVSRWVIYSICKGRNWKRI